MKFRVIVDELPKSCETCPFSIVGKHPFTKYACPLTARGWIIDETVRDPSCPLEVEDAV